MRERFCFAQSNFSKLVEFWYLLPSFSKSNNPQTKGSRVNSTNRAPFERCNTIPVQSNNGTKEKSYWGWKSAQGGWKSSHFCMYDKAICCSPDKKENRYWIEIESFTYGINKRVYILKKVLQNVFFLYTKMEKKKQCRYPFCGKNMIFL